MEDWGNIDDAPAKAAPTKPRGERVDVPAGTHDFQIKQVIVTDDGIELRLEHPDRNYGWVFCRLKREHDWARRLLSQFRDAIAMSTADWAVSDPGDLAGRRVRARVYHQQRRDGDGVWVNVGEFLPPAEPDAAAATPEEQAANAPPKVTRRTPTKKADAAAAMPDDDIPF